jgi:predicted permease
MVDLLGARAIRGRLFGPDEDVPGGPELAVVSHAFWQSAFAGDEAIVGKTIRLNEAPVEVIGVMAPGVELPPELGETMGSRIDVWLPMRINPAGPFGNNHVFPVVARLAAGAAPAEAKRKINQLLPQLPEEYPDAYWKGFIERYGFHTAVYPLKQYVLGPASRNLWILFAAVGLVLVIACANVVNLFLARIETRRREFAVRVALGARQGHLVREAFAEGLVLVLGGGAVASLIAVAGVRGLVGLSPPGIPRLDAVSLDWRGVGFTVALALLIAGALAVLPALRRRAGGGLGSLGQGGRSGTAGVERQRVRHALVMTQMALALILVAGSVLLLQSFRRLRAVDPGFNPEGVLAVEWFPPYQRYDSLTRVWRLHDAVLSRIRALPGVAAAAGAVALPLNDDLGCVIQGFDEPAVFDRLKEAGLTTCAGEVPSTPGYFETLGIPLLTGRLLTDDDNLAPERGAVVVSKAFAERFWPGENPIGKGVGARGRTIPPFSRVVGVVGDVNGSVLDEPPAIAVYYPIVPVPGGNSWYEAARYLVIRADRGDPMDLLPAVRSAVAEVDPAIPIANAFTMEAVVSRSMGRLSFTMVLLALAGAVALALAAIGLYGLISYMVAQRTNEIGVRMALGARPEQVEGFVVFGAIRLAALGLLLGLGGTVLSARVLSGLLYGVAPFDPASYAAAMLVLGAVALVAAWIPARRAARLDPTAALRAE